jgi:hypothetical protein
LDASPVQDDSIPEYTVLRWLEKLGTLAKNGLIDPVTLYDLNMPDYLYLWIYLSPIVERMRSRSHFKNFNNAEYLYCDAERWARKDWGPGLAGEVIAGYRAKLPPPAGDAPGPDGADPAPSTG